LKPELIKDTDCLKIAQLLPPIYIQSRVKKTSVKINSKMRSFEKKRENLLKMKKLNT
jgi:hypothetical protein